MSDALDPQQLLKFPVEQTRKTTRLYGLDWLRVFATLAVVMLHAGIPYMQHSLPELIWAMYSPQRSAAVDLICWLINGCIMPVFFIMSGYFAAQLFQSKGANGFAMHRLQRIGGPLLFGIVFVLPLSTYVWITGWIIDGQIPFRVYRTLKVSQELEDAVLGPAHLWYLAALLVFCLTVWVLARRWPKLNQRPSTPWCLAGGVIGFAVMCLCLHAYPTIVIGFRNAIFPPPSTLLYYAVPFTLGWVWQSFPLHQCRFPQLQWTGLIVLAGCLFAVMWPGLVTHLEANPSRVQNAAVPLLFVSYSLTMACGCFGACLTWDVPKPPQPIQYAAKASLWVYLFHHPMVALTQITLEQWALPVLAKFAIATTFTVAMCLLSYEVLARRTWVAVVLNGRRDLPKPAAVPESPAKQKQAAA